MLWLMWHYSILIHVDLSIYSNDILFSEINFVFYDHSQYLALGEMVWKIDLKRPCDVIRVFSTLNYTS